MSEPRRFSASQRFAIRLRQSTDGLCRCDLCGLLIATLSPDGTWINTLAHEFDHERPHALGGRTHEENGRALCLPCHRTKTDFDVAAIAKSERMAGRTGQQARLRERKAKGERPLINSRGFRDGR